MPSLAHALPVPICLSLFLPIYAHPTGSSPTIPSLFQWNQEVEGAQPHPILFGLGIAFPTSRALRTQQEDE